MTNEAKKNLLKSLLDDPAETPGENKATFINYTKSMTSIPNAITRDQLQFEGYTIGLCGDLGVTGGKVVLFDNEGNILMNKRPLLSGVEVSVIALDIDENGDTYGLVVKDNKIYLAYFNNVFIKTASGEHDIVIKKSYPFQDDIQAIFTTIGGNGTVYDTDIKKSPISRKVSNHVGIWKNAEPIHITKRFI